MQYKAKVGSISSGTMRTEDLIGSFAEELEYLAKGCEHPGNRETYESIVAEANALRSFEDEDASGVLESLFDALNELAPAYCYFGALVGDGADYGFWPIMEEIEELPRVSDPSEVRISDHDWLFVNDHGNITVYSGETCKPVLELV